TVPTPFPQEGTTLITGGTGTLGHRVARHLVTGYGVRNLLLTSRGGPDTEGQKVRTDEVEALGARVDVVSCDVADRYDLAHVLRHIPEDRHLSTVIHAAGIFDVALLSYLDTYTI